VATAEAGFELHGPAGDETRLIAHATAGYALAVPGRPRIVAPTGDGPRYDVRMQLDDAPVEIGLRLDDLGATPIDRDALLTSLAMAYVQARAVAPREDSVTHAGHKGRAPGAHAAVSSNYPLRGDDPLASEFLLVTLRESAMLYLTVRYRRGEFTPFAWGSLRSILLNHQSWTPGTLPSLDVWPSTPHFVKASIAFELLPAAQAEARAKSAGVGAISREHVDMLADFLLDIAIDVQPPTLPWAPFLNQHARARVGMIAGGDIADVLCRDLDSVDSMHDFRGWAWQCYVALGNRPGARDG
jgi:hypothetical protein